MNTDFIFILFAEGSDQEDNQGEGNIRKPLGIYLFIFCRTFYINMHFNKTST